MTCASSRHEYSAEDRGREAGVRSVSIIMDGDNGEFFDLDIDNQLITILSVLQDMEYQYFEYGM